MSATKGPAGCNHENESRAYTTHHRPRRTRHDPGRACLVIAAIHSRITVAAPRYSRKAGAGGGRSRRMTWTCPRLQFGQKVLNLSEKRVAASVERQETTVKNAPSGLAVGSVLPTVGHDCMRGGRAAEHGRQPEGAIGGPCRGVQGDRARAERIAQLTSRQSLSLLRGVYGTAYSRRGLVRCCQSHENPRAMGERAT